MHFNLSMSLFVAALFVLLSPGVVVSLPRNGSHLQKAVVHGILFAIIYHFTHKAVWTWLNSEGFALSTAQKAAKDAESNAWKAYKKHPTSANKTNWQNAKKTSAAAK